MPAYTPLLPSGDWFALTTLSDFSGDDRKWYIERVVLWLAPAELGKPEDSSCEDTVLEAIGGLGCRMQGNNSCGLVHYVAGRDACPDGRSWSEVYAAAPPVFDHQHTLSRDVTAQAGTWWTNTP